MSDQAKGIDVSASQGSIRWAKVAQSGISYAFVKATEGATFVSQAWGRNWNGSADVGLLRGAYHFYRPGADARAQAEHFLSQLAGDPGELPPTLDLEDASGVSSARLVEGALEWLHLVRSATQRLPLVYCSPGFADSHLGTHFGDYPLWLAHYGVASPRIPSGWSGWAFWQHSDRGTVPGISNPVDLNWFHGTEDELQARFADATPRLVLAVRRNGDWNYAPVPSAWSGNQFEVQSMDLCSALRVSGGNSRVVPIREALAALGWKADIHLEHLKDAVDPRVYVFITEGVA